MSGFWRLEVRDEFAAAHALRNYRGKCESMHGHNFAVRVCVEGEALDAATEMLLDFKVIKAALKDVLAGLDHSQLNQRAPFDRLNPSSENLARHIFRQMKGKLASSEDPQARLVRIVSVSVSEKDSQGATYLER